MINMNLIKIFMISALKNDGIDDLLNWFTKHLPKKVVISTPHYF